MSRRLVVAPRLLVLALGATACSGEFVLGDEPEPRQALELRSGTYTLRVGAPDAPDCIGTFANRGGDFAAIDAAAAGLVDGVVDVRVGELAVDLAGAPIEGGFERTGLTLGIDPLAEIASDALVATVPIDRDGVDGTRALVGALGFAPEDSTPTLAVGWASVCYAPEPDVTTRHACTLTFPVTLTPCCDPVVE